MLELGLKILKHRQDIQGAMPENRSENGVR